MHLHNMLPNGILHALVQHRVSSTVRKEASEPTANRYKLKSTRHVKKLIKLQDMLWISRLML